MEESMEKSEQISVCLRTIESLKGMLKIVGTGTISIVGFFFFFKSEFSVLAAQALLISIGSLIAFTIFEIFRKYAIIAKINLEAGENNDD
ncbi:MAG: hypothetical protein WCW84_07925 [Sulfurimonas sp.]|jgi:hypothetical protein